MLRQSSHELLFVYFKRKNCIKFLTGNYKLVIFSILMVPVLSLVVLVFCATKVCANFYLYILRKIV